MNFKIEEALIFLSFVQVNPTNESHEELLYEAIEGIVGIHKEAFDKVGLIHKNMKDILTQDDISEYKQIFNEFEKEKNDAGRYFRHAIIDEKTYIYDVLQACDALVEKVNRKNRSVEKQVVQMRGSEGSLEVKIGKVHTNKVVSKKERFLQGFFKREKNKM